MHYISLFALLTAFVLADGQDQFYSFSAPVGSGSGQAYSLTGEGRITAVRAWESYNSFVYGIQLRFGFVWSRVAGRKVGRAQELELFEDEAIIQISGKFAHYVQSVVFTTNRGRTLFIGQPAGNSFNLYPAHSEAELRFISGRFHGALTAIGAHWAVFAGNGTTEN